MKNKQGSPIDGVAETQLDHIKRVTERHNQKVRKRNDVFARWAAKKKKEEESARQKV